jgi:hypothetical protein
MNRLKEEKKLTKSSTIIDTKGKLLKKKSAVGRRKNKSQEERVGNKAPATKDNKKQTLKQKNKQNERRKERKLVGRVSNLKTSHLLRKGETHLVWCILKSRHDMKNGHSVQNAQCGYIGTVHGKIPDVYVCT